MSSLTALLHDIRACTLCSAHLPLGPRPIVQAQASARILIAGQAPGRKVHETGIPFDDESGNRLRHWLGMSREVFYNPQLIAIAPMGFCFPGSGRSGDFPPRRECAATWRQPLLAELKHIELTLVIGQYAQAYHLAGQYPSVTAAVSAWRDHWPLVVPMPHPSPSNQSWLKRNPWFEAELLPILRARVSAIVKDAG